jgi:hypothetical protein
MRTRGRSVSRTSLPSNKDDSCASESNVTTKERKLPRFPLFKAGQNKTQRLKLLTFLYYDGHKTWTTALSGCLLLLFTNQRCGDRQSGYYECEWNDGIEKYHYKNWFRHGNILDSVGIILNILTLVLLSITFYYEFNRENTFIDKLEVNNTRSQTDAEVKEALEKMNKDDLDIVFQANRKYQVMANITSQVMVVNVVISATLLLCFHYYNFTTVTHLYQLLLYLYPKWDQLSENARASKYKFVSAYMKTKVQFNDCDPSVDLTLNAAR